MVATSRAGERDGERVSYLDEAASNRLSAKLRNLDVFAWETNYYEPVLDGEEWELEIEDVDGATFRSVRTNGYPENFDVVLQLFVDAGLPEGNR